MVPPPNCNVKTYEKVRPSADSCVISLTNENKLRESILFQNPVEEIEALIGKPLEPEEKADILEIAEMLKQVQGITVIPQGFSSFIFTLQKSGGAKEGDWHDDSIVI